MRNYCSVLVTEQNIHVSLLQSVHSGRGPHPTYYVVGIHGSSSDRDLHLPTRRHLLVLRTGMCGTDPPLPVTRFYDIHKYNLTFILPLRSIKFESGSELCLC